VAVDNAVSLSGFVRVCQGDVVRGTVLLTTNVENSTKVVKRTVPLTNPDKLVDMRIVLLYTETRLLNDYDLTVKIIF